MIEYLAVAAGPLIILGIILFTNAKSNYTDIKENWVKYRCHPAYMPFTSMFDEKTSTYENFAYCTNTFAKHVFSYATEPVYTLFDMFNNIIKSVFGDINQFLKYIAGITNFVLTFTSTIFGKMTNSVMTLNALLGKVRDLFQRIVGSAYYAAFTVQTLISFVISIFSFSITLVKALVIMLFALSFILALFFPVVLAFVIPLGTMVGISYCFHPLTKVKLHNGREINIEHVQIGDRIGDSIVTSVFTFDCLPEIELYDYNGIIVSGRHLVYHDGKWRYVKDTGALVYNGIRPDVLICLNTSNNKIPINNNIFRDYEEIDCEDLEVNEKIEKITGLSSSPVLHPRAIVPLENGTMQYISELCIGDVLLNGSTVTCHVNIDMSDSEWYYYKGCIFGEEQPILHEGKLQHAKEIGVRIDCAEKHGYQIFTDGPNGLFEVGVGIIVQDYPDSHDPNKLEYIQKIVLETLNH